jgi:ATP-dependent Zn protease
MLFGPPGTGKTSAAKALAGSCGNGVGFIATSFSRWTSTAHGYLGETIKAMRAEFDEAKKRSPCVMFCDEMDSIVGRGRSHEHDDYWRSVTNALLECLDGIGGREGVVFIGAANDISGIDAAVLRSGRMDRVIEVRLPDAAALAEILADHLGAGWHSADMGKPARLLLGRSGADAARVVRDARQAARRAKRDLAMADVVDACHGKPRDPDELRATALHEAAHALVAEIKSPGSVDYVSLADAGEMLGGCAVRRISGNQGRDAIEDRVTALLAGRAVEELLLGGAQAGCGGSVNSDLSLATGTLLRARLCQGLYGEAAWRGDIGPAEVAAILRGRPDLHRWIEKRLAALQDEALGILAQHDVELVAIAGMLTENTVLTGEEVREILVGAGPTHMRG